MRWPPGKDSFLRLCSWCNIDSSWCKSRWRRDLLDQWLIRASHCRCRIGRRMLYLAKYGTCACHYLWPKSRCNPFPSLALCSNLTEAFWVGINAIELVANRIKSNAAIVSSYGIKTNKKEKRETKRANHTHTQREKERSYILMAVYGNLHADEWLIDTRRLFQVGLTLSIKVPVMMEGAKRSSSCLP